MIRIENVSFHYGDKPVLTNVSLKIPPSGVTALIGPNGAGKSTLLSLIARLNPLQSGQIVIDDLTVGTCKSHVLARKLAILPQSADISTRLSVRELVSFGRYPHHRGRPTSLDIKRVDEAISAFQLDDLQHRQLDSLSGGQRQRAQIAMTFAQDTDYILLDEPLNNLDIAASRALMKLLVQLAKRHGRTIVVVLHDINYASAYADHIVTMQNGQIAATGHPADVISEQLLSQVFSTDASVLQHKGQPVVCV